MPNQPLWLLNSDQKYDNIFVLLVLAKYNTIRRTKLFCAFIDFRKAFDYIWRVGLWSKLLKYNIIGKILTAVKNMYTNIKSCISINGEHSDYFQCHQGIRQGEHLSPIMFSLYLNDLENYLSVNCAYCLEINDNELNVYSKLFVLLYADDTVVFATSEETLTQSLNLFANYCNQWKLDIKYDKTKVLVVGDRINRQRHIRIENYMIEMLNEFKYLSFLL